MNRFTVFHLFTALQVSLYRASSGRLGGTFRGAPVMLLTTVGRRSGKLRTTPVLYVREGRSLATVASAGGSDHDPSWWSNLKVNRAATIRIKKETLKMMARKANPEEKARLWPVLAGIYPTYNKYQEKTKRQIPVIIFDPATAHA